MSAGQIIPLSIKALRIVKIASAGGEMGAGV
jgi:hypothetical protein